MPKLLVKNGKQKMKKKFSSSSNSLLKRCIERQIFAKIISNQVFDEIIHKLSRLRLLLIEFDHNVEDIDDSFRPELRNLLHNIVAMGDIAVGAPNISFCPEGRSLLEEISNQIVVLKQKCRHFVSTDTVQKATVQQIGDHLNEIRAHFITLWLPTPPNASPASSSSSSSDGH